MKDGKVEVGVIGAGLMGAEVALLYALAGHDVLLADTTAEGLATALRRLDGILDKGIARNFYQPADKAPALARIRTTTALEDFGGRDMVTEAVFEDEAGKAADSRRLHSS